MFSKMNMKRIVLWLFTAMVISFMIAGSILVSQGVDETILGGGFNIEQKNIDEERTHNLSDVKGVDINTVSTDINIIPVDSNEIKVHLYGNVKSSSQMPGPELVSEIRGGRLYIEVKHRVKIHIGISFNENNLKLDILLPKSYASSIDADTVSGNLNIREFNLDELSFSSVSGNLLASSVNTMKASFNTTSGKIECGGFSGDMDFNSISGDMDVEYSTYNNNITANTTSGHTKIKLPEGSQFNLEFNSATGDFKSDFPMTTSGASGKNRVKGNVGSSSNTINIGTVSGDAEITK